MLHTNIQRKLQKQQQNETSIQFLLEEVGEILKKREEDVKKIKNTLSTGKGSITNDFIFDLLETDKIYHINAIKNICIDYRLRFLDSNLFKGEIPQTAFSKISELEKKHQTTLEGFKIMAPSKLFKLADKDDPLLFAPIGNGYFYLIHKWGNDLHPLRKMLVWPFKNLLNLTLVTMVISYFATLLIPHGLFSKQNSTAEFWIIYFFMFKSIAAVVLFYGFAMGKNFNPAIWNSKYFNA